MSINEKLADNLFLHRSETSWSAYQDALAQTHHIIYEQFAKLPQPYSGLSIQELQKQLDQVSVCPEEEQDLSEIIATAGQMILQNSIGVNDPNCCAHLHCPPMIPSLAAEAMISASNQSMDSWDQSSVATLVEQKLIHWLCELCGYEKDADGVFTSGGTQSNFMGLLLARDHYIANRFEWNVQRQGLPQDFQKLRILCSKTAHFTVKQSAALLGLGEDAVVTIETDSQMRICFDDLDTRLKKLDAQGLYPFALVATAGSTDFGEIDPISECKKRAQQYGMWLHVDAAYGGALLLSDKYKHLLSGMENADSITVDFHKLFYQPISCGAFLTKKTTNFNLMKTNADYLNPKENEEYGFPDLVAKSIQTTRRFDALKLWISLQTLGRKKFAKLIEYTISLAQETAQLIIEDPMLELLQSKPSLNAIVFRYISRSTDLSIDTTNKINSGIRQSLLNSGKVIVAQTKWKNAIYLKLTILNPRMEINDIHFILDEIKKHGHMIESQS